jgi:hypothetical protein
MTRAARLCITLGVYDEAVLATDSSAREIRGS